MPLSRVRSIFAVAEVKGLYHFRLELLFALLSLQLFIKALSWVRTSQVNHGSLLLKDILNFIVHVLEIVQNVCWAGQISLRWISIYLSLDFEGGVIETGLSISLVKLLSMCNHLIDLILAFRVIRNLNLLNSLLINCLTLKLEIGIVVSDVSELAWAELLFRGLRVDLECLDVASEKSTLVLVWELHVLIWLLEMAVSVIWVLLLLLII